MTHGRGLLVSKLLLLGFFIFNIGRSNDDFMLRKENVINTTIENNFAGIGILD